MRYYFAWLGSKRAAKRDVAEPGCLLDKAAANNLPVPAGGILLHDFYELALAEGVVQQENGQPTAVSAPDLHHLLYEFARFPRLEKKVVLRPLQGQQLGPEQVPLSADDPLLAKSLCEAWQQQNGRHDVLLITHPQATVAGTAVTQSQIATDKIVLPEGSMELEQLGLLQRPDNTLPPHMQRLQMLLRGVRRTFGDTGWEVVWKDDGRICWLWEFKATV